MVKGMHVGGGKSGCKHFVWDERNSQKGNDMVYVHVIFFFFAGKVVLMMQ